MNNPTFWFFGQEYSDRIIPKFYHKGYISKYFLDMTVINKVSGCKNLLIKLGKTKLGPEWDI